MGFSPGQQGVYRPLLAKAWALHSQRNGLNPKDKVAYESWYQGELLKAIGKSSTKYANRGKDFDLCKEHFTAICGDSIEASLEVLKADAKRIIFLITQVCKKHTINDAYVLGTARNITGNRALNNLHQIEDPELLGKIRTALIIHARRLAQKELDRAAKTVSQTGSENPF